MADGLLNLKKKETALLMASPNIYVKFENSIMHVVNTCCDIRASVTDLYVRVIASSWKK